MKRIEKWLKDNGLKYKITWGGEHHNVENLDLYELKIAIVKDITSFTVCDYETLNFMYFDILEDLFNFLEGYKNESD